MWSHRLALLIASACLAALACRAQPLSPSPAGGAASNQTLEPDFEGAAHGFPSLRELNGKNLADGEFTQWLEGGHLHVRIVYQFSPVHRVEESALFVQKPQLVQESWSWQELNNDKIDRRFEVDLRTGKASAEKLENGKTRHWSGQLKVEPGQTFAGFGFALAIMKNRGRLIHGQTLQFQAVGFTPKPRLVSVEISYAGLDHMLMSGRTIHGDRFVIHPKLPKIAQLFVTVPDTRIWLINPPPAGFLRWEGPLAEPSDPVIRVDLLPGNESGPAEPG